MSIMVRNSWAYYNQIIKNKTQMFNKIVYYKKLETDNLEKLIQQTELKIKQIQQQNKDNNENLQQEEVKKNKVDTEFLEKQKNYLNILQQKADHFQINYPWKQKLLKDQQFQQLDQTQQNFVYYTILKCLRPSFNQKKYKDINQYLDDKKSERYEQFDINNVEDIVMQYVYLKIYQQSEYSEEYKKLFCIDDFEEGSLIVDDDLNLELCLQNNGIQQNQNQQQQKDYQFKIDENISSDYFKEIENKYKMGGISQTFKDKRQYLKQTYNQKIKHKYNSSNKNLQENSNLSSQDSNNNKIQDKNQIHGLHTNKPDSDRVLSLI
ncbi:hypothetical protein PPERSA_02363 [Pseudocohnilembus persalinus]|uniref:Uncharacterized protein n=1 Tax=Pseudocohnilembus persalinus TaxID=266149 RepID=A0A0V0QUC9_PSEPJ|nr:hypothetical protein PPERSA_02363 [Pseudocohnilembus persalinus]|eukprot:KRX05831.1 hypothetical protein PPERSA_02363 [Pseudocohnilembus persalinus]